MRLKGAGPVGRIANAFEGFIFRGFNPFGRASRSEYWIVILIVWAAIIAFFLYDLTTIWGHLRAHERPSFNPFAYGSVLLWTITLIPRTTLAMRRMQDSGRSLKWAMLPFSAGIGLVWLVLGLGSAMLTSMQGGTAEFTILSFLALIGLMRSGAIWPLLYAFAEQAEPGAVLSFLAEIYGLLPKPDLAAGAAYYGQLYSAAPEVATPMLLATLAMTFGPFVMLALWFAFLLAPSNQGFNGYGEARGVDPVQPVKKGAHNPYAGYALLSEQFRESGKQSAEVRREEVSRLYRERVLKQRQ